MMYDHPNAVSPGVQQPNQATVIVVNQTDSDLDYTMKGAVCPGAFMIVIAIVNFIVFIVLGAIALTWTPEYVAGFIIYVITGILAVVGSAKQQDTKGVPVATLLFAIVSLFMSFCQIILRGIGVGAGALFTVVGAAQIGTIILYTSIALLVCALIAFALAIALIVLPSQVLCCRKTESKGVVIHQTGQPTNGGTQVIQY